jgi:hypothetical protein
MQNEILLADLQIHGRSFIERVFPVHGETQKANVEIFGFDGIKDSQNRNNADEFGIHGHDSVCMEAD